MNVPLEVGVPGLGVALAVRIAALDVVLDEFDVFLVEAVRGIGMAAVRRLHDDVGVGDRRHERVLADHRIWHDALGLRHDAVGGTREPAIAETRAEVLAVAVDVGPADMNDRPIWPQRRDGDDLLGLADRVDELDHLLVEFGNAGADAAAPGEEFLPRCRGEQASIEHVFAGFLHLDLAGFRIFAIVVADRAVHFLSDIGRDQLLHAAGADQKIDLQTGRGRRDDGEIFLPVRMISRTIAIG